MQVHGLGALESALQQGLARLACACSLQRWSDAAEQQEQEQAGQAGQQRDAGPHQAAAQRLVRAASQS